MRMRNLFTSYRKLTAVTALVTIASTVYFLHAPHDERTMVITPTLTSSAHATMLPNATKAPVIDFAVPAAYNPTIQLPYHRI